MNIKYLNFALICLLFLSDAGISQNIESRGRLRNSVYFLEQSGLDATTGATQITRIYQFLRLNAGIKEYNNLTLNISGRALTDGEADLSSDERFRAYRLSLSASGIFNGLLDFEIGRQFLHPGIPFGSMDGLNVFLHPSQQMQWQVFGGTESHIQRSFKVYEFDEAAVFGFSFKYKDILNSDFQLAYLHQRSNNTDKWQVAGLNISNRSADGLSLLFQAHYDLVNERFHRFYVSSLYRVHRNVNLSLRLKQQYPQIFGNSLFRIFEFEAYQQAALGLAYAINRDYSIGTNFSYIQLEEGSGQRFIADISNRNGSVGVVYESGDLGDQIGLLFDYGYEIFPDLLASLSVDYTRYRFEEIYDYENQLANALRLTYRFTRNIHADLEYQWLSNRFKDSDQRLLNHINYIW